MLFKNLPDSFYKNNNFTLQNKESCWYTATLCYSCHLMLPYFLLPYLAYYLLFRCVTGVACLLVPGLASLFGYCLGFKRFVWSQTMK